ncbi:hypothetical protein Bca4012_040323 [Brassica carinata]|uniref:Purple acid phosphatase N-terminal domain-containing protein n=1 Tax=Brassica carinata TaxID=52824 RepID=A0A8X7VVI2_BRACI|nr:hypothetical protein Bca52824_021313 [Brassica carinata]
MAFRHGCITTSFRHPLLLLFFCFLSPASFSDAYIPSTLDGPFTPVTVQLDTTLRGKADDLPDTDPRVLRRNTGLEPKLLTPGFDALTDVLISWITGEFLIPTNVKSLDQTSIDSIVQYGTSSDSLTHTATGYSLGIVHHVRITGLKPSTVYYYRCADPSRNATSDIYHFKTTATMDMAQEPRHEQSSGRSDLHCETT